MRYTIIKLTLAFFLTSCGLQKKSGVCENAERVNFRGLKFSFPLRGDEVNEIAFGNISYVPSKIKSEPLITKKDTIYWYFDHNYHKTSFWDTTAYLKESIIYGVTIRLYGEDAKRDQEFIDELQKYYPGEYVYHKSPHLSYYILSKGCLKVIYRRIMTYNSFRKIVGTPSISFCYGLTENQAENYANSPGALANSD